MIGEILKTRILYGPIASLISLGYMRVIKSIAEKRLFPVRLFMYYIVKFAFVLYVFTYNIIRCSILRSVRLNIQRSEFAPHSIRVTLLRFG